MKSSSVGVAFFLLYSLSVQSADIIPMGTKEGTVTLRVSGPIREDDGNRFEMSIDKARSLKLQISTVYLDSPGGIVRAGARMARLVRAQQFNTAVADGATCASACFLIFAAGKERFAGKNAKIGVHSATAVGAGETDGAKSVTIDMVRFLSELGVPPQILGKLVTARPTEIIWLTSADLRLMRVNNAPQSNPGDSYVEKVAPPDKSKKGISPEDIRKADRLMSQGLSHIRAKQPLQAVDLLKEASRLNPFDPDIAATYGNALHLSGNNVDAKGVLMLALQIKLDFSETYRVLALTAAALNDQQLTLDNLQKYYKHAVYKEIAKDQIRSMANTESSATLRTASQSALRTISEQ